MNIFFLDKNVKRCAQYHVDKHVVKMILEYSQILSTAHRVLDGELITETVNVKNSNKTRRRKTYKLDSCMDAILYRATHINHPCVKWTMESDKNYIWLYWLLESLHAEYTYRYNRCHKSIALLSSLEKLPNNIRKTYKNTPVALAMPEEFKCNEATEAYRQYYMHGKRHLANWKNRSIPSWYV